MKNNLKFNSAICTSRVQSERLLALGIKKETADMYYYFYNKNTYEINPTWKTIWEDRNDYKKIIPAWSLGRLIEMMPEEIYGGLLCIYKDSIRYEETIMDRLETDFEVMGENMYENAISCIEWLIKEGYFNKEYLV